MEEYAIWDQDIDQDDGGPYIVFKVTPGVGGATDTLERVACFYTAGNAMNYCEWRASEGASS